MKLSAEPVIDYLLLSHHLPRDQYRCVLIPIKGRRLVVCTRCLGAVCGVLIGMPLCIIDPLAIPPWILLLAFPDWICHVLIKARGWNWLRFLSGICIGLVYSLNIWELILLRFRPCVWAVNAISVMVYAIVVWWSFHKPRACSLRSGQSSEGVPLLQHVGDKCGAS